ncbi:MAG: serine protease [Chthoniobacter sp.]|nr:serine protease [Chthoniobacter sp.]
MNAFLLRCSRAAARPGWWVLLFLAAVSGWAGDGTIAPLEPQYRDRWKVDTDKWDFQGKNLVGTGNSKIHFQGPFQVPFTLEFRVTVLDGMRPRVHLGPVTWGNEGYEHTFQIGPNNGGAPRVNYELNKEYRVVLFARKEGVEMQIDGKPAMVAVRKMDPVPEIVFRGGDNWSKGTTRFSDIVIKPSAPPADLAALPAPMPPAERAPEAHTPEIGELVKKNSGSLAFIEGQTGSGSGFVADFQGKRALFTNLHVLAHAENAKFTLLDRSILQLGASAAAVDHDVARIDVASGTPGLTLMEHVEQNATIGDDIVVLGNAEGQRVINPIRGKLVGIGPNLVEVDAAFLPGNSGSPIIHLRTGQVIGIATYVVMRRFSAVPAASNWNKVRRFGYRLDSIQQWQPIQTAEFFAEGTQQARIEAVTEDLIGLWREAAEHGKITPSQHQNPLLQKPIADYLKVVRIPNRSQNLAEAARKDFLWSLRNLAQGDVTSAKAKTTYDYFQRKLTEETRSREEIYEALEKAIKL